MTATTNSRRLSFLLLFAATCASAGQPVQTEASSNTGRTYDIGGQGSLSISVPNDWKDEVRTAGPSVTVRFIPPSGNGFKLLVTAHPNLNQRINLSDSKQARELLTEAAQDAIAGSVEKELTLVELKGKGVSGYRYTLTDKAPKPGEFPLVTGGILNAGELLISFTILHRDSGKVWTQCIDALRSIQTIHTDNKAANAQSEDNDRVAVILQACEKGDGLACGLAAEYLMTKSGNEAQAFKLTSKGCALGSAFSCATLGAQYDNAHGVSKDEALAVKYFKKACEEHNGLGCLNLAAMTYAGRGGLAKDERRGAELILRACEFGNETACKGYPKSVGAPAGSDRKAYCEFFGKRCSENHAEACNYAAWCAESGYAAPKDAQLAKTLYAKACASTSAGACFHLGELESDSDRALGFYRTSCQRGYGYACFTLAKRLDAAANRNPSEVKGYFRRACEGDVAESCEVLIGLWSSH